MRSDAAARNVRGGGQAPRLGSSTEPLDCAPRVAPRLAPRVGYTFLVMIVPEAIEQLDSLRERLHGASERLSWLRSYL